MIQGLTKRQLECFCFIKRFIAENHYSPTIQEIANDLRLPSKGSAHRIVTCLVERGYITSISGKSRSIAVVADEFNHLDDLPSHELKTIRTRADEILKRRNDDAINGGAA